jgi:hypothetical protein
MRALMAAAGTEDPAALDPDEVDAEALAYIAKQVRGTTGVYCTCSAAVGAMGSKQG